MDKFRIDGHKLMFHPKRVSQWLDGRNEWETAKEIYPLYVEISPVGACNHRCTFCTVDYIGYKSTMLSAGKVDEVLHELGSLGVKSVMFAGEGEPLLHRRINQMVSSAKSAGLDVAFTTNGVLLDKLDLSKVSWVKVSLNAGSRETYAKVHRTKPEDFDRVIENLAKVDRYGCSVGAQMVLLPENQHEVPLVNELAVNLDYFVIKPYMQHGFSVKKQYESFAANVPRETGKLVVRKESFDTKTPPYDKCQATPFMWAYIMSTGDVYSCSAYLLDDRFNLGNINSNTFKEIWQSEKRKENWQYVREKLDIHECKVNCRMDKVNRYMNELLDGVPSVNFI